RCRRLDPIGRKRVAVEKLPNPGLPTCHRWLLLSLSLDQSSNISFGRAVAPSPCVTCLPSSVLGWLDHERTSQRKGGRKMLWTIFVILMVLWLLGVVSSYTMGGFIHLLLVIALAVVLIRVISGRTPVV